MPPALTPVPPHIVNLHDHSIQARQVLDDNAWAYFSGGAADEITLQANTQAWSDLRLLPRVLAPLAHSHTRVQLLGQTLPHPILIAPMAHQRLAHGDGELATALAAAAQGAGLVLSTQSSTPMEDVAQAYRRMADNTASGTLWFQLVLQPRPEATLALVRRAEQAGFEALVLTVDAPVQGVRDRERRAGFRLPPGWATVHTEGPAQALPLPDLLARAPTWADVRWLVAQTRLPVLLKGILHPDDARQALEAGASGVIVSNHGGRTLDTAVPTALALPGVARAVGHQMAVLVDGGIRRGTDVFKALALGAHAVLVGRPLVHALSHGGAVGVAHALRLLRDELEATLALCGCQQVSHASPEHLWPR
jgi:4-hydroxymandelate oxidase